jgi:putative membrane protein
MANGRAHVRRSRDLRRLTMTFRIAAASAMLLALCACGPAADPATATVAQMQMATPAPQFVARAAMFETYQIQAARIAQQNAQSQAVKTFAAASLAEHQATLQQLNGAVQAAGMPAPSGALDGNYNAYLDMLRHADAQNFDSIYASQQALAYMSASGLYDSFTSTAPDSPLKLWAQRQAPRVHDGITAARTLARNISSG